MECIRGKVNFQVGREDLRARVGRRPVLMDIGTGDGRFARHISCSRPDMFVIGVDACRENLVRTSRYALSNALFVVANANALPEDLAEMATTVVINFPWGSLMKGLLDSRSIVWTGIKALCLPPTEISLRANAGALLEQNLTLEQGTEILLGAMQTWLFGVQANVLSGDEMNSLPTTWAKRLAYGRDARGVALKGTHAGASCFVPLRLKRRGRGEQTNERHND